MPLTNAAQSTHSEMLSNSERALWPFRVMNIGFRPSLAPDLT